MVSMAVTLRSASGVLPGPVTNPAMVPPTEGGLDPVSMTGPGWHPGEIKSPMSAAMGSSLMV